MKIIIYATHSFGTFDTLKTHPDVIVLGYGTKWKGFIERVKVVNDYVKTLPDNEVVVIVDGFDSYIKKTDGLRREFESMDCKVLLSLSNMPLLKIVKDYVSHRIFTKCKDDSIANAGLMMGYVEYLKIVFDKMIKGPSTDDQRNLNLACKDMPFLKIDIHNKILHNCTSIEEVNRSTAYFCQIPGTFTIERYTRAIFEYSQYFIPEIIALLVSIRLIIYIIIYLLHRKYIHIMINKLTKSVRSYLNKMR
jgi:hypothetical protein